MRARRVSAAVLFAVSSSCGRRRPWPRITRVSSRTTRVCGFCHGPEGRGDPAPRLVPLAYEADYILAIVREGYGEMPPISTRELTDEQIGQVVEYLEVLTHDPQREQTATNWSRPAVSTASRMCGSSTSPIFRGFSTTRRAACDR